MRSIKSRISGHWFRGPLFRGSSFRRSSFRESSFRGSSSIGSLSGRSLSVGIAGGALLFIAVLLVSGAAPEKHLSIYSSAATYSLPIVQRQGHDYVGLLELLDPLGKVSAKFESPRWRLHYNNVLGEFFVGKSHARIQGRDVDLSGKFLMENGRGFIPVASLSSLLPRIL